MRDLNRISESELSEILSKHRLWLAREAGGECANLRFCDLRGVDLSCKDLRAANLSHSNFEGADLSYVRGCFMTASASDFGKARMGSSDFTGANFEDTNLSFCDLSYSVFNCANIRGADLTGSNIAFANLMKSNIHLSRSIALEEIEENAFIGSSALFDMGVYKIRGDAEAKNIVRKAVNN